MEQLKHTSARRKTQYKDKVSKDLGKNVSKALVKEERRKNKKASRRAAIEQSSSYQTVFTIKKWMDDYYLDPILGLIPVFGDMVTQAFFLPYIYVALFKVRSIPLTLAVLYNSLLDVLLGSIPFWIGNILDIFFKSYKRSYRLIVGFVSDDRDVIREVNKRAIWMALGIALICYLIYLILPLVVSLTSSIYDWVVGLFA